MKQAVLRLPAALGWRIQISPMVLSLSLAPMAVIFVLVAVMFWISFQQRGTYGGIKPIEDIWKYIFSGNFLQNYARSLEWIYLQIFTRSFCLTIMIKFFVGNFSVRRCPSWNCPVESHGAWSSSMMTCTSTRQGRTEWLPRWHRLSR